MFLFFESSILGREYLYIYFGVRNTLKLVDRSKEKIKENVYLSWWNCFGMPWRDVGLVGFADN